jgi:hypothetical protein
LNGLKAQAKRTVQRSPNLRIPRETKIRKGAKQPGDTVTNEPVRLQAGARSLPSEAFMVAKLFSIMIIIVSI